MRETLRSDWLDPLYIFQGILWSSPNLTTPFLIVLECPSHLSFRDQWGELTRSDWCESYKDPSLSITKYSVLKKREGKLFRWPGASDFFTLMLHIVKDVSFGIKIKAYFTTNIAVPFNHWFRKKREVYRILGACSVYRQIHLGNIKPNKFIP